MPSASSWAEKGNPSLPPSDIIAELDAALADPSWSEQGKHLLTLSRDIIAALVQQNQGFRDEANRARAALQSEQIEGIRNRKLIEAIREMTGVSDV